MKNKIIAAATLFIASMGAQAEYQTEMNASLSLGKQGSSDVNSATGSLSVYFDDLDPSNGPQREAAFLNKSSDITIAGLSDSPNFDGFDSFDASASGRYVTSESNRIIEVQGGRLNGTNFLGLGLGTYVGDNTSIMLTANRYTSVNGGEYRADFKNIHAFADSTASLVSDVYFGAEDFGGELGNAYFYGFGFTYYFNNSLGLGLDWESNSLDNFDSTTFAASLDYFVTEEFAITAGFSTESFDANEGSDPSTGKSVSLAATLRF